MRVTIDSGKTSGDYKKGGLEFMKYDCPENGKSTWELWHESTPWTEIKGHLKNYFFSVEFLNLSPLSPSFSFPGRPSLSLQFPHFTFLKLSSTFINYYVLKILKLKAKIDCELDSFFSYCIAISLVLKLAKGILFDKEQAKLLKLVILLVHAKPVLYEIVSNHTLNYVTPEKHQTSYTNTINSDMRLMG